MNLNFKWIGLSKDKTKVVLNAFDKFNIPLVSDEKFLKSIDIRTATIVDVETTGLSYSNDEVIEIAARNIFFNSLSGKIEGIGKNKFYSLNEPSKNISPKITKLTGISDKDVKGKNIDWEDFGKFICDSQIIISHNAFFDRSFIDKYVKNYSAIWGCSLKNIDWPEKGFDSSKLGTLCIYHGFFNLAHRAMADVDSLIHLLTFNGSSENKTYFEELVSKAHETQSIIRVKNTKYEAREKLASLGFRWVPDKKYWVRLVSKEESIDLLALVNKDKLLSTAEIELEELPLSSNFKSLQNL